MITFKEARKAIENAASALHNSYSFQPKTHQEVVLWYLYYWNSFTLKDIINDCMLYKFQTRLSELEKKHGELANRKTIKAKNKFGHSMNFFEYSAKDKEKIKQIIINLKQK